MIIKSAEFIKSAVKPEHYPETDLPEVAFAGRSNVGKSSLINTLVNRKKMVKTSSTPGRTQLLNFFCINGNLMFTDLPGYGYAKVPMAVKKNWGPMVETYLKTRKQIRIVILIFDIRRSGPSIEDMELLSWLVHERVPYVFVLTKADKLSGNEQTKSLARYTEALGIGKENFILFSSKTRKGLTKLWEKIEALIMQAGEDDCIMPSL